MGTRSTPHSISPNTNWDSSNDDYYKARPTLDVAQTVNARAGGTGHCGLAMMVKRRRSGDEPQRFHRMNVQRLHGDDLLSEIVFAAMPFRRAA